MKEKKPRIEGRKAKLIVPHKEIVYRDVELGFVHPSFIDKTYETVGKKILESGLSIPTGYQTASLIHGAYNSEELEFRGVQDILLKRGLWVFNANLWTPDGVYVVYDSKARGCESLYGGRDELEERLRGGREIDGVRFNEDRSVSFAPKESYKLGDHTPESLAKDGFVIASFGPEGAEKLGEVASKFKGKPEIFGYSVGNLKEKEHKISSLFTTSRHDDCGLLFSGSGESYYEDYMHAYGVQKTDEAIMHENGV